MSTNQYLLLGYVVGLGLLWGYPLKLLLESMSLKKREQRSR
jgi:hypothetical protein